MPLIRKAADPAPAETGEATDGLASAAAATRWAAVRALPDTPASVAPLAQALAREGDERVREAIFTALVRIATPDSAAAVLPSLRADDANLRTGAFDALRAMPAATRRHVPHLLADTDADVRLLACDLMRDADDAAGARRLCALLDGESQANVCAAAVEVLAEIGDAEALPALARCAARFPGDPFLGFAIKVAADRLGARDAVP
jgi:HEAT repeat protein